MYVADFVMPPFTARLVVGVQDAGYMAPQPAHLPPASYPLPAKPPTR